jgi:3-hydroxy-9,10-secoandrosta-1,3,5(10)-triene-9,17-dione monooxygenase
MLTTDRSRDAAGLYARARALVPELRKRSAQTIAARTVPAETIADFQRAGFFRVLQPKRFGGLQLDFPVFANLVRELAYGCGSSAWVYAVMGELGWVMAMFPEEGQAEVWSDPAAVGCAAVDPAGRAERAPGGFRLNGQWRFVSGSDHAQWVMVTAPADDEIRQFLIPRAELETVDDWFVLGLIGTGSRTLRASNLFVPERRSITQRGMLEGNAPGSAVHSDYPVCRAPRRFLTAFSLSPVLVGLAERALTLTIDAVKQRIAAGQPPADLDVLQLRIGEAAAEVETARMMLDNRLADAVARLAAREPIGDLDVQRNRMIGAHIVRVARSAVDRLCIASGSGWLFDEHPLQVIFRDAVAGATHRAMNFETNAKGYVRSLGIKP